MDSKIVDKFCKDERFSHLAKYFKNMWLSDLAPLRKEELLKYVPDDDKLTMSLFINKYIASYLDLPNPFDYSKDIFNVKDGHLDLCQRVKTVKWGDWCPSKGISSDKLESFFTSVFSKDEITSIDLSQNDLEKEDMPYIFDFVAAFPLCHTVDLKWNRISYDGEEPQNEIKKLLELENIRYVIIVYNFIGGFEGTKFLRSLDENHLRKLIFVAKRWLNGDWKRIIKNETKQKIVVETHNQYFEKHKECTLSS